MSFSGFIMRQRLSSTFSLGRILVWVVALCTIATVLLEGGVWKQQETHTGPFSQFGGPDSSAVFIRIRGAGSLACCLDARGNTNPRPLQSDLRLWLNGQEMGPPHGQHAAIIADGGRSYGHWDDNYVMFSLPEGVANMPETTGTVVYSLRPSRGITLSFLAGTVSLGLLFYGGSLVRFGRRTQTNWNAALPSRSLLAQAFIFVARTPFFFMRALGYFLLIFAIAYAATIVAALASGWALPTTAFIRWSGLVTTAAQYEPMLPYVFIAGAVLGTLASWMAAAVPAFSSIAEGDERVLSAFFRRWGLVLVFCALVFSLSGVWAGLMHEGDYPSASIGGLIAFSDAGGYFAGAHDQAKSGVWNVISARRPLAAALRSVLLFFGNFSYAGMLLLQALLLSATTYLAARALAKWRGIWAGIAFVGLVYITVRPFLATVLTEPLGLIWALSAVPFFIEALRTRSAPHALLGFAITTISLMTRMGSMFTIPALCVWLVWQYGQSLREKIMIGLAAIGIVVGVFSINTVLQRAYGTGNELTGSNFAYTLCGLALGNDWSACPKKYDAELKALPGDEKSHTDFLYSKALDNVQKNPGILIGRLIAGAREFLESLPDTLWRGYIAVAKPPALLAQLFLAVSLCGLLIAFVRRREWAQLIFWTLLLTSIVASASVVYFDDGRRVMAGSYPLLCLFMAMGLVTPAAINAQEPRYDGALFRSGIAVIAGMLVLFFFVPWIAHKTSPAARLIADATAPGPEEHLVFGGQRMTGMLVIPDAEPLRNDIPSLHFSAFAKIIAQSNVEIYQGLLHPDSPPLPFGFVASPRLEKGGSSDYQYIVPAHVLERRDVKAWRFQIREWQRKPGLGPYWFYVAGAEPLP